MRATMLAALLVLVMACGKSEQAPNRNREDVRPIPAARSAGEVGSGSASGSSQVIIASSSQGRGQAGAGSKAADSRGGGGVDLAAESRAQTRARCDRLVEHIMGLTRTQLPKGEAREKLDGQGEPLREMCMDSSLLAGGYERCVMRAKTLNEVLTCNPVGDERAAKAVAVARKVAARKDLLDKAEREIERDGGVAPPTIDLKPPKRRW
jgi:hypothetical protein